MRFLVSYIDEASTHEPLNERGGPHERATPQGNDLLPCAAFDSVSSDFLLNKYCKSHLGLIEPQEYILGENEVNGKITQHSILAVLKQYLGHRYLE